MTTENSTTAAPASASNPPSPGRKWIFRAFVLISFALIAFEARAKYGYEYSLNYLVEANKTEEIRVTAVAADTEAGKVPKNNATIPELEQDDAATWAKLRSEAFGSVSFLAPVLSGIAGDPVRTKPVLPEHIDTGEAITLRDRDGNAVELNDEPSIERTLRWHSLRDLWSPEPVYQLTVKMANDTEGADIVGFTNGAGDGDPSKYFVNPDNYRPSVFDPNAERSAAGMGGPAPQAVSGGGRNRDNDSKGGRPARPAGDDESDDDMTKEEAKTGDDVKADGDDN